MRKSIPRAVCCAALALAFPATALAQQSPAPTASDPASLAQQHYRQGIALYEQGQFVEALAEFRAAQAQYPSPNSRLYIARCLRGLGRLDEATVEYSFASHEAEDRAIQDPRYAPTHDAAENEMHALAPQIGRLRIVVPAIPSWAYVSVSGRQVAPESLGLAVPVMPGAVVIDIEAHGYRPERRQVTVAAGSVQEVAVQLERDPNWNGQPPTAAELAAESARRHGAPNVPPTRPAAPPPRWMRPASYVTMSVGAAAVLGAIAFGTSAFVIYNGVVARCGGTQCPVSEQSAIDTGRAFQVVTNVSIGVGVVGVLGGAALWWFSREPRANRVTVGFTGNSVVVGGVF